MFIKYFAKRRLVSHVKELAIYNDKGIHWRSHDSAQVAAERKRIIELILVQLPKLGNSESAIKLNEIITSGALAEDDEGQYIDLAKSI
ncbi:hypothetical protein H4J75_19310 [Colwellia sp. BRX10-1]|nr:hypothetical protein [Colwellia sp. BRX10-7]MBA6403765.1 hypothetical protein [Colwellia sp. BRX10-5]MBA6407647.1 hypothetical protein [Colwellia sp. BRX10-1]